MNGLSVGILIALILPAWGLIEDIMAERRIKRSYEAHKKTEREIWEEAHRNFHL